MATAPVKPQQLHNFPISLKWGQTTLTAASNHHNHHNRTTSSSSNNNHRLTHDSETESDPEQLQSGIQHRPASRVGSRSARVHRFAFTSCSSLLPKVQTEIPQQKNVAVLDNNKNEAEELDAEEEENSRPWKLRPRKGILTGSNKGTAAFNVSEQREKNTTQFQQLPKSMRLRGLVESSTSGGLGLGNGGVSNLERKEKRKFWIALSREEIEEDVFILTGSRPARRPTKRPKSVQKVLDSVFPGLWLVGTTADSYRVADPPVKR